MDYSTQTPVGISNVKVKTYHGSNLESLTFERAGKTYYAKLQWDNNGVELPIEYGRSLPNEYYIQPTDLFRNMAGMNNTAPRCVFGTMPKEIYLAIRKLA